MEEIEKKINIKEQYEKRVEILKNSKVINLLSDGKSWGVVDMSGEEYKIPNKEEVISRLKEKKSILEKKINEGFTYFMIVPMALPLLSLTKIYGDLIYAHSKEKKLFGAKNTEEDKDELLYCNKDNPVWIKEEYCRAGQEGALLYFPENLNFDNSNGKKKLDLIKNPKNAWTLFLLEEMPNIPHLGKGQSIDGRNQIESGKSPKSYFEIIKNNEMYKYEEGLTIEEGIIYAINILEEKNQVAFDLQKNSPASFYLGNICLLDKNKKIPKILWTRWCRINNQYTIESSDTDFVHDDFGIRTCVRF